MRASFTYTSTCIILFSNYFSASAQTEKPKWEASVHLSSFIYQGDLAPSAVGSLKTPGFGIGFSGTRILSNAFSVRANIDFGKLKGDDAKYAKPEWRQQRNFNFSSSLFEASANIVYDVFWNNYGKNSRNFSPYLFAGIGFSKLKINRDHSNFNTDFFKTEQYIIDGIAADDATQPPRSIIVFPAGAGIKYAYSNRLSLFAEGSYRFMFTDYLDGFSKGANPSGGDHYYQYSIGITYRFGNSNILCPRF